MAGRSFVAATALTLVGVVAAAAPGAPMAERPPLGHTGGFGEPTCALCHTGNEPNAFDGVVRIEGLPDEYRAGEQYLLTVRLAAAETVTAGFQLAARHATGSERSRSSAGSFTRVEERVELSDSAGVTYVHHSAAGVAASNPEGSSWTVLWEAPADVGPIMFHVAANSGNGDDSPLGDLVYTEVVTVEGR